MVSFSRNDRPVKFTVIFGVLSVLLLGWVAFKDAVNVKNELQQQEQTIRTLDNQTDHLNTKLDQTTKVKEKTQEEVQKLEKQNQDLENERNKLQTELQAKRKAEETKLAQASDQVINAITFTQTASAASRSGAINGCGDNQSAAIIYGKESGGRVAGNCDTAAVNSLGCIGIGQNCPDKNGRLWLAEACPDWRTNYDCQNAAFTKYALDRYGSWEAALEFHKANNWW